MDEIEHGHRRGAQAEQEAEIVHQQHGAPPRVALGGCQRGPDEVKQGFEVGGAPAGRKKRDLEGFCPPSCPSPRPADPKRGSPACATPAVPNAVLGSMPPCQPLHPTPKGLGCELFDKKPAGELKYVFSRAPMRLAAGMGAEIAPKCWGIGEKSLSEQQKRGLP